MYFLDNWYKFVFCFILVSAYSIGFSLYDYQLSTEQSQAYAQQLSETSNRDELRQKHVLKNNLYPIGWGIVGLVVFLVFLGDMRRMMNVKMLGMVLFLSSLVGCYRPFEPVKLEVVASNEEAFLLPYLGNGKQQTSSSNEEYLKENLVYTKQVKIPQQWVPKGYEWWGANGVWNDAAILIRVDKSPCVREWTADEASGTSTKNEAVWVMCSDGVEFSTGWTITARIDSRENAIKFLHNYPNGALVKVLDSEVRSKLQAVFGLEVTDLPMKKLQLEATPHILKTVKEVTEFFKTRGITITNLGITGGFVYKDKSIASTLVKVFNAEQQKNISAAENASQEELNKKALSIKKTEADGIKLVADAKLYELEKTKQNLDDYISLKQMELQKELLTKWDGSFPQYYISSGANSSPNMLLQLPQVQVKHKEKKVEEVK